MENIQAGITCRSKPEETLLAPAILSIINWLLQVFHYSLLKTQTNNPLINDTDLLEKSGNILNSIVECEFMMAMCCLAKYNDIGNTISLRRIILIIFNIIFTTQHIILTPLQNSTTKQQKKVTKSNPC